MSIKALVVGVSNYSEIKQNNLPFCAKDITLVIEALNKGLLVERKNIKSLGNNGIVKTFDFINVLKVMISEIKEEDTFIFYFSGHGGNLYEKNEHHLLFSDEILKTQEIINLFDCIPSKNKIIILDSCMSGNFKVEETAVLSEYTDVADFFGKGYAVFSSSNADQSSWGHPTKQISLFSSFLCEAITDRHIIKKGNKSLHDIQKLLFFYLENWNKNNPSKIQNPIFRANMGGTILFPVEAYTPYNTKKYHYETNDYIIYSVEAKHSSIAKRYSVKVILKNSLSFEEISIINHEIVKKVRGLEIYNSKQSENKWNGILANIIFCYYGRDESDITNDNYICHTTWIDENQDKSNWYMLSERCEIINNIHFNYHSYYNTLKVFQGENTGEKTSLLSKTKKIISQLVSLAEKVIGIYNEFINGIKSEQEFIQELNELTPLIEKLYSDYLDLDLPTKEVKEWSSACSGIVATIYDFTLFYNDDSLGMRNYDNRISCMNITKDRYFEDLEKLKTEELKINSLLNSL